MRSLRLFLTVSAFVTYFVGMISVSAVATGVVHAALSARSVPMTVGG
jgi:hypothetical protein